MTSAEAKSIADNVNQAHIDKADGDLNHVLIEVNNSAENGEYNLRYGFHQSKDYSLVNEIRNQFLELGYEASIEDGLNNNYDLIIDWSKIN